MILDSIVIVGGGPAAHHTAVALRAEGHRGPVTLVTRERTPPYRRSALVRGWLTGELTPGELTLGSAAQYQDQRITVVTGDPVDLVERNERTVLLASGRRLPYRSLVLATGARARAPRTPGAGLRGVLTLRTLEDAEEVRRRLDRSRHLVVVGGGLLGLELAAVARSRGHEVTVVEAGRRVLAGTTTGRTAAHLTALHRRHGTRILPLREVSAFLGSRAGEVSAVLLDDGQRLPADLVVAGIGVLPATRLAVQAGLHTGDGVLVDRYLRTSDPNIYALGDCARFPSELAGRHLRLESERNALDQANCLARVLCGRPEPYTAVPCLASDQFTTRVRVAGVVPGHDRAVVSGDPDAGRFTVYCYRGDRLVGVESVNRPREHLVARSLLSSAAPAPAPHDMARGGFALPERVRPLVR